MHLNRVSLDDRIESIRAKLGDTVTISEVGAIVGDVMGSIGGDFDLQEVHFKDELQDLLCHIDQTKAELFGIQPRHLGENKIPEASNQLDQVIVATEEAASKIMDAAEEISDMAMSMEGEAAEKLMAISTHIFETSSFQDITGQRVTKVVTTLKYLEEKLMILADAIGDTDSHLTVEKESENMCPDSNENLLQGPQSSSMANDQDAIDALFDSFD